VKGKKKTRNTILISLTVLNNSNLMKLFCLYIFHTSTNQCSFFLQSVGVCTPTGDLCYAKGSKITDTETKTKKLTKKKKGKDRKKPGYTKLAIHINRSMFSSCILLSTLYPSTDMYRNKANVGKQYTVRDDCN
jgi:hypothetical protein